MAAELVSSATSNKLKEADWTKNIEICELVGRDHRQAKDVVKAIKKRLENNNNISQLFALGNKREDRQLFAVMLLEMLMNNIGEPVHRQVIEAGILPVLVKIVKKKSEHPVRERIFLLLDAAQTAMGGASGRFPQYYSAYYELVSAGVKFPQRPRDIPKPRSVSSAVPQAEGNSSQVQKRTFSDPRRVMLNAAAEMEVLRDILDTIDTKYLQAAKDEFTLEIVEQCCFEKQKVMHLALTSLDEGILAQAVVVNEQLDIVLQRHKVLLEQEKEEAEQLYQRMRKGKACLQPKDGPLGGKLLHCPLTRPLTVDRQTAPKRTSLSVGSDHELGVGKPTVVIPPPPAKHVEREKFFQVNNGSALSVRMRSLSLHSRDASSSHTGSTDFNDL